MPVMFWVAVYVVVFIAGVAYLRWAVKPMLIGYRVGFIKGTVNSCCPSCRAETLETVRNVLDRDS